MPAERKRNFVLECYPEIRFGGFTRCDGTIPFYSRVQALLRPTFSVLAIGCGRGAMLEDSCDYRRNLQTFKGKCAKVLGIDVDPAGATNPSLDEFRLIEDERHWPVDDQSIELAVCDYVLEHVAHPDEFMAEARRVLKPGGVLCARTPNKSGYVAVVARLIPQRLHGRVLARLAPDRKAGDVFTAYYRCNSKAALTSALRRHGFDACVYRNEGEPSYLQFSRIAYQVGAVMHRWLPDYFKSNLLCFARKT